MASPSSSDSRALPRLSAPLRAFVILIAVVLTVTALRLAETVLVPLVAGLFLAVLVRPVQTWVQERLPAQLRWVGLLAAMLLLTAALVAFGGILVMSGRAIADEFRERRPQIEAGVTRLRTRMERSGVPLPASSSSSAPAGSNPGGANPGGASSSGSSASGAGSGATTGVLRAFASTVGGVLLALAFAALSLAEAGALRQRIAALGHGSGARRALDIIDETAPLFRRYLWVKSVTSAITGLATFLIALAFGLPLAWVWGLIAFLLEYVPSVGSLLAVVPPTVMAVAEGGMGRGLAVFLTVGAAQIILGNVVDPKLEGKLMAISPFGVLLSIVFWGWLWGPAGALLAVPLSVALVIASRHVPGAHGFATLVAGDGTTEN